MIRTRKGRAVASGLAILASAVFLGAALRAPHGVHAGASDGAVPADVTPSPVADPTLSPNDFSWQGASPVPLTTRAPE